jgi:alpha-L-rhamnosidase
MYLYLKGKGRKSFGPRFNLKGFQYVEVMPSRPVQLTKESLVGYFMHSEEQRLVNLKDSG